MKVNVLKNCKFFNCRRENCYCCNPTGVIGYNHCGCYNCSHSSYPSDRGTGICEISETMNKEEMEEA